MIMGLSILLPLTFILLLPSLVGAGLELKNVYPALIVEPFVAAWCANQFPEQLGDSFDGYTMAAMVRGSKGNHVKLEPYLGEWCFDQFPQQLPPNNQDRETVMADLDKNHKQIEPYLELWGHDSLGDATTAVPNLISVEPYIGHWCSSQWPEALADLSRDPDAFFRSVRDYHVKLEPALAEWCFAQFPESLSTVKNNPTTLEGLKTKHEVVENELIQWVLANDAATNSREEVVSRGALLAWAITATALLVVSLSLHIFSNGQGRRSIAKDATPTVAIGNDGDAVEIS